MVGDGGGGVGDEVEGVVKLRWGCEGVGIKTDWNSKGMPEAKHHHR